MPAVRTSAEWRMMDSMDIAHPVDRPRHAALTHLIVKSWRFTFTHARP
jgi:hypothetical protein